jgi:hypothetical protein
VYICDVCVLVCFHSKLVFRIKGCGEIGCQFIVNFHNKWYQSYGCGEMQSLKFGIERLDGVRRYCSLMEYGALFMCRGTVHGRSTEHCSRAEVLFMEDDSWSTVHESLGTGAASLWGTVALTGALA